MKQALLIAGFGTSIPEAFEQDIEPTLAALTAAAGDLPVYTAFTSPTIRRIWAERGRTLLSVSEALEKMAGDGVEEVFLQPIHLIPGFEYDRLSDTAREYDSRFSSLHVGRPLLGCPEDIQAMARILNELYPARSGSGYLLLGHGTEHAAYQVYPAIQSALDRMDRSDILIGTVEGELIYFDDLLEAASLRSYYRLTLAPLLLVAGEHARSDMAGPGAESRANRARAAGFAVDCRMEGLGRCAAVRDLYVQHLRGLLEG